MVIGKIPWGRLIDLKEEKKPLHSMQMFEGSTFQDKAEVDMVWSRRPMWLDCGSEG